MQDTFAIEHPRERRHITFVLPSLVFGGGIESHMIKLFSRFDRSAFSFSLITFFDHPERPDLYSNVPSDVQVFRLASKGLIHISTWKALVRALRTLKPDMVVSSMFSPNTAVRLLKPFFGYKVITREHNTYEEKRLRHRIIEYVLAPFSNTIVAVSSDVADFASHQSWISRERFTVINNGVDIEIIETFLEGASAEVHRVREELHLSQNDKIILNVARIKPTKDHVLLVDAFELFAKTHPNYHLVIVGDGSERPTVEAHIQKKECASHIHLMGYRKDIFAFFAAADICALSSKREGFPNVGLEAIAFGVPFVSTKVSGVGDIIKEGRNGSVITERSAEQFAEGLRRFADVDLEARKKIAQECKISAQQFDIRTVVEKYEKIFLD